MRIESSNITMSGKSSSIQSYTKKETLKTWIGNQRPNFEDIKLPENKLINNLSDVLEISDEGKAILAQGGLTPKEVSDDNSLANDLSDKDKQKILMIQKMIESLSGKKFRFYIPKKLIINGEEVNLSVNLRQSNNISTPKQGWGLEFDSHEVYYESQKMSFSSAGKIKTTDGREINFSMQMNMSSEFYSEKNISIRAGDAVKVDPLVINFDGNTPKLTEQKYSFDIDSNGTSEQISFLSKGSGFLALDANGDDHINNGSELFGPNSGNGFSELAQYDSDENNWIDENDEIYDKLRIWTKDDNGNDVLFALGQKGIGAIYLGNINTSFDIKDSSNAEQGSISKSGIFLKEDGTPGTIQHIDLAL